MPKRARCRGTTAAGTQCKRLPKPGEHLCAVHKPGARVGRPTNCTPELANAVATTIRLGAFREQAALANGVAPATLYSWLERGQADLEAGKSTVFAYFTEATTRARAEAEVNAAEIVRLHSISDWRAAAFYLERAHPERWRRRDALEHSGTVNPGKVETVAPDESRRGEIARILQDAGALRAGEDADRKDPDA